MKREIKFRGKTGDGVWLHGDLCQRVMDTSITYKIFDNDKEIAFMTFPVLPNTIGQFTGLLDKNGKEIYEGDIVCANHFFVRYDGYTPKPIRNAYNIEIDQKGLVTSVLYSRNYAIEFYPNKGWIMRNGSDQHRMHSIKGEAYIEVIGNIHDNPELLSTNH